MDGWMTVDDPRVARAIKRSFVNELLPDVLEPLILVDARRPDLDEHAQRVPTRRRHQLGSMGAIGIVAFPRGPEKARTVDVTPPAQQTTVPSHLLKPAFVSQ